MANWLILVPFRGLFLITGSLDYWISGSLDQENGRLQWVVRFHCDRLCPVWVFPFDLVVDSWSNESTGSSESKGSDAGCVAPSLDGSAFLGWSSRLVFAARGMRLLARGSWLVARGTWLMAHGAWLMAHGSWHMAHGSWLVPSLTNSHLCMR
jgi:hypothetical protein